MRNRLFSWFMILLLAQWHDFALAHAIVVTASPRAHASVAAGDVPIVLEFNSRIDASRSKLTLQDPAGNIRELALESASAKHVLRATARGVAPGEYRLEWFVLSADGHITRGRLNFKVQP